MFIVQDAAQIHDWDTQTIKSLQLTSLQLMERAAQAFVEYFVTSFPVENSERVDILCGPGNNGGDGAAIARLLEAKGYLCSVFGFCETLEKRSTDLIVNWERLEQLGTDRLYINTMYAPREQDTVVIDALFGVGTDRPLSGDILKTVVAINANKYIQRIISVDVPSGQKIDGSQSEWLCVQADETVTFAGLKQSALFEETSRAWGTIYLDDLEFPTPTWVNETSPRILQAQDEAYISIVSPRRRFSHKGNFGHVLIIAGSRGHAGAALLSGIAAYRTGCGLVTFYVPRALEQTMQLGLPEAMCLLDPNPDYLTEVPDLSAYDAIVVGPGIGKSSKTKSMLRKLFENVGETPIIIDADALNLIAEDQALVEVLPTNSILTPHPKEFARLSGDTKTDFERFHNLSAFAKTLPGKDAVVVLKDQYTMIVNKSGEVRINFFAGNPGMATGGMGDALTGVIASLAAQGLPPFHAAGLGVLLHAKAGDLAAQDLGEAGLLASDVAHRIGIAIQEMIEDPQ